MNLFDREIDAGFYNFIHEVIVDQLNQDRRTKKRLSCGIKQRIAPYFEERVPAETDFYTVECHDLSQSGFSFFSTTEPEFQKCVVALDFPGQVVYMVAEVKHCYPSTLLEFEDDSEDKTDADFPGTTSKSSSNKTAPIQYIVGCQFKERLTQEQTEVDELKKGLEAATIGSK